eukprot:scaffold127611_cov33-Phaeocystis_antarctica.AAC.1
MQPSNESRVAALTPRCVSPSPPTVAIAVTSRPRAIFEFQTNGSPLLTPCRLVDDCHQDS